MKGNIVNYSSRHTAVSRSNYYNRNKNNNYNPTTISTSILTKKSFFSLFTNNQIINIRDYNFNSWWSFYSNLPSHFLTYLLGGIIGLYFTSYKDSAEAEEQTGKNGYLYYVDTKGQRYMLKSEQNWRNTVAMTSIDDTLYIVQDERLFYIDKKGNTKRFGTSTWENVEGMTSIGNILYIVKAGTLYAVNQNDKAKPLSRANRWHGLDAITSLNDAIYIVHNEKLFLVDQKGHERQVGSDNWDGTEAMTALKDCLYMVRAGKLYLTDLIGNRRRIVENGKNTEQNKGEWYGTSAMAAIGDKIYIIQHGNLHLVDPNTGKYQYLGKRDQWYDTDAMALVKGKIYIAQTPGRVKACEIPPHVYAQLCDWVYEHKKDKVPYGGRMIDILIRDRIAFALVKIKSQNIFVIRGLDPNPNFGSNFGKVRGIIAKGGALPHNLEQLTRNAFSEMYENYGPIHAATGHSLGGRLVEVAVQNPGVLGISFNALLGNRDSKVIAYRGSDDIAVLHKGHTDHEVKIHFPNSKITTRYVSKVLGLSGVIANSFYSHGIEKMAEEIKKQNIQWTEQDYQKARNISSGNYEDINPDHSSRAKIF